MSDCWFSICSLQTGMHTTCGAWFLFCEWNLLILCHVPSSHKVLPVCAHLWLIHRSPERHYLWLGCCCPCCSLLWVCEWASENRPPLPTGSVVLYQCTAEIAGVGDCGGGSVHPYALYNILPSGSTVFVCLRLLVTCKVHYRSWLSISPKQPL